MRIDSGFSSSAYPVNRSARTVTPVREIAGEESARQGRITVDNAATQTATDTAPIRRVTAANAAASSDAGANGLVLSEREGRFANNLTARAQQALASYGTTAAFASESEEGAASVVGLDLYA